MISINGRSSRFKLHKLRTLSYKFQNVTHDTKTHPNRKERLINYNNTGNRDSDPVCSKYEHTPSDSSTFVSDFSEFSGILNTRLLKSLEANGFVKITHIQRCSIPKVLNGATTLIRSPSGTGKTLTFIVPALQRLIAPPDNKKITRRDGTKILIITPTRELSFQISKVTEDLSKPFPWIVVSCIKGGESRKSEKARIRKGITVVIGTPGRVLDHMESTSSFKLDNLEMLVLDEADRLLDMGFESKIRTIHSYLLDSKKSNRENSGIQIVLTSATITERVKNLVENCFDSKPQIIGLSEENSEIPTNLRLEYVLADCNNKFMFLISLLLKFVSNREKIIIFVSNCDTVNYFYMLLKSLTWPTLRKLDNKETNHLRNFGQYISNSDDQHLLNNGFKSKKNDKNLIFKVPIFKLHGDMESSERFPYMDQFINSECSILISTDVASRGLNFSKVDRVIQYDPPQQLDEFIHRSGRTARIGDSGTSILILIKHEKGLVKLLNDRGMKLDEVSEDSVWSEIKVLNCPKYLKKFKGDLVGFMRNRFCMDVKGDDGLLNLAKKSFMSSIRSYKTYSKELRKVFNFRNLHLGHYATSLCLNMKPTELMNRNRKEDSSDSKKRKNKTKTHSDRPVKQPKISLSEESKNATELALKYLKENKMIL
ncbi:DEAD/DEAH box helicase family protein [Theileria parva strain Muguga]|uniref:DEAD/DEAH box helicase family protein n=1 Tax=Theileria parva strain Muguga TaxID=333668 RepID=UPI001C61E7D5|nr:DEAD/DEAH box helicase family protein [Theileria parva strain Muguga]EAN34060.2 DEAD/DEAH box helicase family protein [Theileria parva strain Muguga]